MRERWPIQHSCSHSAGFRRARVRRCFRDDPVTHTHGLHAGTYSCLSGNVIHIYCRFLCLIDLKPYGCSEVLEFPAVSPYNVSMAHCYYCGTELPYGEKVYRSTLCTMCEKPLKICRNCEFYLSGAKHDCREPIAEPVYDKERANSCDLFSPSPGPWHGDDEQKKQADARKKLNSLFNF